MQEGTQDEQRRHGFDPPSLAAFIRAAGRGRVDAVSGVPGVQGGDRRGVRLTVGDGVRWPAGRDPHAADGAAPGAQAEAGAEREAWRFWWRVVLTDPDGRRHYPASVEYDGGRPPVEVRAVDGWSAHIEVRHQHTYDSGWHVPEEAPAAARARPFPPCVGDD